MPRYLTPSVVDMFFNKKSDMNFFTFINKLYAYRQYITISFVEKGGFLMNFTAFTKAL